MQESEKNPFEDLFSQIGDLLSQIQNNQTPLTGDVPPEVMKEVDRLEKQIGLFCEMTEKVIQDSGIDIHQLQQEARNSSNIKAKDKRILERAKQIELDAKNIHFRLSAALNRDKGKKTPSSGESDRKKQIKERRKKYKSIGGDRGWIPL
jgi:hypothetical protein